METIIRKAVFEDLQNLLDLYAQLSDTQPVPIDFCIQEIFKSILSNQHQHILVADIDGKAVSTATVSILESLTHNHRPYAVVEHVVTLPEYRGMGLAAKILDYAQKIAEKNLCYKMMLITGRTEQGVHQLYQKCGYSPQGKTAYVKEL